MSAHDPKRELPLEEGPPDGPLVVCGISYNTATLAEREPYQVGRADLVPALKEMMKIRRVKEALILSTCNRFEAYLVLDEGEAAFSALRDFFLRFRGLDPRPDRRHFYVRHGSTAVRHLFRVTAGLDSMVLGEYQIQSQVKEAYSAACSVKAPGKVLHRLFHVAFRAGKAVRTRTKVGAGRMSVAGMAVGVLKERLGTTDPVLMVGVNENIRIVAEGLAEAGMGNFLFANRTLYKAEKLAVRYGGEGFGLDRLGRLMARVRAVVTCTGAPDPVIRARDLRGLADGECPPVLIVDMAVPRDVERPESDSTPVELIDLEDLKGFRDSRMESRKEDLPAAKRIIEDTVSTFQSWMEGAFDASVGALVKEFDRVRKARLDAALPAFAAKDRAMLETFSRDLVRDLLRVPMGSILRGNGVNGDHGDGGGE